MLLGKRKAQDEAAYHEEELDSYAVVADQACGEAYQRVLRQISHHNLLNMLDEDRGDGYET
jgi:hypothetical protein